MLRKNASILALICFLMSSAVQGQGSTSPPPCTVSPETALSIFNLFDIVPNPREFGVLRMRGFVRKRDIRIVALSLPPEDLNGTVVREVGFPTTLDLHHYFLDKLRRNVERQTAAAMAVAAFQGLSGCSD